MNRRTKGLSKMDKATKELKEYYTDFENDFTEFFSELIKHSKDKRLEIEKQFNL